MTAVAPPPVPPRAARATAVTDGPRRVGRRGSLPGGRAVVGALLVALSAIGVFLAHADATRGPGTSYVVARGDLAPGHQVSAADVEALAFELPETVAGRAFRDPAEVLGRVVLGPVGAGEVLQASSLSADAPVAPAHEVVLILPREQVALSRLQRGDRVDLFVTAGERTASIVRGALVVAVGAGRGGAIAEEREAELVVAVPDAEAVAAVVHALRTGEVTAVRSTFAHPGEGGAVFHPPTGAPGEEAGR